MWLKKRVIKSEGRWLRESVRPELDTLSELVGGRRSYAFGKLVVGADPDEQNAKPGTR